MATLEHPEPFSSVASTYKWADVFVARIAWHIGPELFKTMVKRWFWNLSSCFTGVGCAEQVRDLCWNSNVFQILCLEEPFGAAACWATPPRQLYLCKRQCTNMLDPPRSSTSNWDMLATRLHASSTSFSSLRKKCAGLLFTKFILNWKPSELCFVAQGVKDRFVFDYDLGIIHKRLIIGLITLRPTY